MNRWPDSRTEVLSRRQALALLRRGRRGDRGGRVLRRVGRRRVRLRGFVPLGIHAPRVEHRSERDGEQRRPAPSTAC